MTNKPRVERPPIDLLRKCCRAPKLFWQYLSKHGRLPLSHAFYDYEYTLAHISLEDFTALCDYALQLEADLKAVTIERDG